MTVAATPRHEGYAPGRRYDYPSKALVAGRRLRPLQARGNYLDPATGGASALMTIAEATARKSVDPTRPAEVLGWLKRFPILDRPARCPVCAEAGDRGRGAYDTVGAIVELHLNDRHGWTRGQIAVWLREVERAEQIINLQRPSARRSRGGRSRRRSRRASTSRSRSRGKDRRSKTDA